MRNEVKAIPPQGATYYAAQSLSRYSVVESLTDNLASEFCKKLCNSINQFDELLDPAMEVGMRLVSFGQAITFSVNRLGYTDPSLIHFFGMLDTGQPVELIQHVSQISFLLTSVQRVTPTEPKQPIGFAPVIATASDEGPKLPD